MSFWESLIRIFELIYFVFFINMHETIIGIAS